MANPINLLRKIFPKPRTIPASDVVKNVSGWSEREVELLKKIGIRSSELRRQLEKELRISYERSQLYKEFDRATEHWLVGAALELYAEVATAYSSLHGSTVWVTSENGKIRDELTKLLEIIGIEEKIFDWAYTVASLGDLFVEVEGEPGIGVLAVDDSKHPISISRVDYRGRLLGFFNTPHGNTMAEERLQEPWKYIHFRLLGVKKKRPLFASPLYSEYRTINILSPHIRRITSKYGTSLILNALPVDKRLRLAEDSLLIARLSRGVLKYIWKVNA